MEFEPTNWYIASKLDDGERDVLGMVKFGCRLIFSKFSKSIHQNIHKLGKGCSLMRLQRAQIVVPVVYLLVSYLIEHAGFLVIWI